MTYSSGGLIEATDYNGFISTNSGANINSVWSVGSSDFGWGESALSTVASAATITATQWATLVNQISAMGSQTGTTITSRTAPVAGNTIAVLANVNADLTSISTNRGNAAASGSQYVSWTGTSGQTNNISGVNSSITFTHTVNFNSAAAARYFFNAGGLVKIAFGKSSTGNMGDPEFNDLAQTLCGSIFISGRVNNNTQSIAGVAYTGTTKIGGSGTPNTLTTTTGWYQLSTSNTIIYKQFGDTGPYTGNYIQVQAKTGNSGVTLDLTTTWFNAEGDTVSGGTAPSGASFGTCPATLVTYFPPSSTYLTSAAWGTPTVAATTA
jgi:hypothetical protein